MTNVGYGHKQVNLEPGLKCPLIGDQPITKVWLVRRQFARCINWADRHDNSSCNNKRYCRRRRASTRVN